LLKSQVLTPQKELGLKIRSAREDAGLDQWQLAEVLYLHHSCISKIESGDRKVEWLELVAIAQLLKKDVREFL
jgi:ribosome-binding protein aMBF1 (putative translation factor)